MRKTVWISALAFAVMAGVASAGTKESAKVEVPYEVSWAGKLLPAGEYTFEWQGEASDVDVTVRSGHKVVAQGRGKLEEVKTKSEANAVGTRRDTDGTRLLTHVDFRGRTTILTLAQS